jgi:hypothetical protein
VAADYAEEVSGYDEVDEGTIFRGGAAGDVKGGYQAQGSRRHGKSGLSSAYGPRGRPRPVKRPAFSGFRFGFDARKLAGAAGGLLLTAALGVLITALILYYTFFMNTPETLNQFYGALAASMVFMLLLAYLASRLLGAAE